MHVRFWGTRGSLPRAATHASLRESMRSAAEQARDRGIKSIDQFLVALDERDFLYPLTYGGNSSCTEVSNDRGSIYIDSGSGLVHAGDAGIARGQKEFHIFQTHFHWDHILGFPFFVPIYTAGVQVFIYHVHATGPEDMKIQFNGRNFPVRWEQLQAQVAFKPMRLYESQDVHGMKVTPFALDHPGGSFGYRVDCANRSFAIGVDGEYKRFTQKDLGRDLSYYQNLDVFVFDGQYDMDELAHRYDWGHSTPSIGVDLALREGIRNLILTHHDPRSSDQKTARMLADAIKYRDMKIDSYRDVWAQRSQPKGPNIFSAFDGMTVALGEKTTEVG